MCWSSWPPPPLWFSLSGHVVKVVCWLRNAPLHYSLGCRPNNITDSPSLLILLNPSSDQLLFSGAGKPDLCNTSCWVLLSLMKSHSQMPIWCLDKWSWKQMMKLEEKISINGEKQDLMTEETITRKWMEPIKTVNGLSLYSAFLVP